METKTQVSDCSAVLVLLPKSISHNMLDSCDTLSTSINKALLPTQNFSTHGLPECYVRLVRLPENITLNQAVKASEFNSFECVNTSQQHISSEKCHYIELDNHSSYCLTCKQLIQDFHQFKQNVQSRGNESSFCRSMFNRQKGLEWRGLSVHDNKSSAVAVETELNLNEHEEKDQDQNLINKQKRKIYVYKCSVCPKRYIHKGSLVDHMKSHTNEKSFKYPASDYSATKIFETTDPIVAANQNLKDDSEHTEEDEHKDVELKNEEAIKVETETNSKIICSTSESHFEEDMLEPYFEDIKIEILEANDPIVAENFKLDFEEDEFKKNVQSQRKESSLCSSDAKLMEAEQFACHICQNTYTTKVSFQYHMKLHKIQTEPKNVTVCPICNKRILNSNLKRHMLTHTGEKPFACDVCLKRYTSKTSLEFHLKSHTGEKPFCCTKCDYSAKTNKQVLQHYNNMHAVKVANSDGNNVKQKKKVCPICNIKILQLKRHMLTHTGEKPFQCNICQKCYTAKHSLEYHIQLHTKEKPFHCVECDYSAKMNKQVQRHYNRIHAVKVANTDGTVNTKKTGVCPICNKTILQLNLKRHMLTHTGEKLFQCNICQICCTAKSSLEYHIKSHTEEKPFRCTECDYSAKTDEQVRSHYNHMHTVKVPNSDGDNVKTRETTICPICNLKILDLRRHMLTHTGEKPFECNICHNRYITKYSLEYHIKSHTEGKPYRCIKYDYSAKTNKQLRYHYNCKRTDKVKRAKTSKMSHKNKNIAHPGNSRRFKCAVCRKCFRSRILLMHHRKTHTEEKSFKCTECDYLAEDSNTLQNHCKSNHTLFMIEEVNVEQPHLGNVRSKILETVNSTIAVNPNLIGNSENTENNKHNASEEGALEPHFHNIRSNILEETDATSELHLATLSNASEENVCEPHLQNIKTNIVEATAAASEPHFDMLSNASKENILEPHFQNIKIEILEATNPIVAVNFKLDFEEDEFKKNIQSQGNESLSCSSTFNNHSKSSDVPVGTKFMETEQNRNNVSTKKTAVCPICSKKILNSNLKRHLLTHTGKKPFECNICQKRYTTKNSLEYHLKLHTDEKPFFCPKCDYSAKTGKQVRYHYNNMHTVKVPNSDGNNVNTKNNICSICNKIIPNSNLKRHMLTHTGEKPFECYICQKCFTTKKSLVYHIKLHTERKYSAKTDKQVREHYNRIHTVKVANGINVNTKKTICPICNKRILQLKRHMLTHTGEKPFGCNICQKRYTTKDSLEYHIQSHTGEKPFRCTECDYSAKLHKQVREHYNRIHTDKAKRAKTSNISHPGRLRRFECDVCPKCFRSRILLLHHRKTHTEEKSFKCTECDYLARDSNKLQNHYKNNHTFFVIEEVNVEQPRLVNIESKTFETINPTVAVNQNLKCNSANAENDKHSASEEKALEPHFQNIKIEILEATDATSEPHLTTLNNASEEDACEPHLRSVESNVFSATDSTFESHFDTLSNAFDEDMHEPHFQNVKSNICEAVGSTVAVNFEEPEHIQNSIQEEVKVKNKATHINIHTEGNTKTSEASDFKEWPKNLQVIKPEEVQIKDELTCEDNPVFTAVQEDEDNLGKRPRIGAAEQPYVCNECKFETVNGDNFKRHMLSHKREKLFTCNLCEFRTAYKRNLRTHMYIHRDDKPFTCSSCNFKTVRREYLKRHMRTHSGEKPFVCSVCGFKTTHKYHLQRHLRIHTGEALFACSYCEYKCLTKASMDNHINLHTGEKPFACHLCDYKTTRKSNLCNHMLVHTNEKPFACDLCDFRSKHKYNVINHMLIHSGEKRFACNLCEYKTAHKKCLQVHMANHRSEKLYACSLCSFGCANKKRLQEHVEAHKRRKVFVCKICKFQTRIKWLLRRHNCSPESVVDNIKNESAEVVNIVADSL